MSAAFLTKLGDLKGHIEASLEFWKVPGVAVAIVKDGEVVLSEGYGYKDLENKKKMTANTVLPIGSATKSFTSMAAGILADDGQLDWDTPVNEYIPGFKMFDPVASAHVSIRDMLCHRTGMPRHDLMWAGGTGLSFTREELIRRVRFLENNAQFREKGQYQNHMFATVGHAVEKISGKSWEDFVKEKIFTPLGMKHSNFHVADSQKAPDYGMPYRLDYDKNEIQPAEFMELGAPGPAGSINSTVNDMTNWIKLILGKGAIGDTRVVSEERMTEMLTAHTHMQLLPWEFPEIQLLSAGLGWFVDIYRGHRCYHHGGNVTGFTALVTMLPDQDMGICILANMNSTFLTYALQNEIYDRVLGAEKTDWNARYKEEIDKLLEQMNAGKAELANSRKESTKPSLDLDAYVGEYEHPGYGTLTITKGQGDEADFNADFNGNGLRMTHFHYDQFSLHLDRFGAELPSRFSLSVAGEVESLSVPFEGALGKDIVFTKKAEAAEDTDTASC
ncbi:MAG: serine hydrolase [Defluviitaleaceae bacterium]|nr:serine hydrolase [Defluviitaleaceae bacterium]